MSLHIQPMPRAEWTPLPYAGCRGVEGKFLLRNAQLSLALLRFQPDGVIHEHSAGIEIDVICLEGQGKTSVADEIADLRAGEQVRWRAGIPHRLWTESDTMLTLMVEYLHDVETEKTNQRKC